MIVGGTGSKELAKAIAKELGQELAKVEFKRFPDGEIYVRALEGMDKEVVVVQGMHAPQYDNLMELLLLVKMAKENGAEKVTAVVPYFAHARQDKVFEDGEIIAAEVVAGMLKGAGVDRILTVDLHFFRKEGKFDLFGIKGYNVTAADVLTGYVREKFPEAVVITPDGGSAEQAKAVGGVSLQKVRKDSYSVEMGGLPDVEGKDVLILDDMITSGGTMRKAIDLVRKAGARKIVAAATHAAFTGGGYEKVKVADFVVTTDCIPHKTNMVSVGPKIAGVLKSWK